MKKPSLIYIFLAVIAGPLVPVVPVAWGQYPEWAQRGSYHLLTTAEGADLPEGVVLQGFPVLLRLAADGRSAVRRLRTTGAR